jgi:hypothetical protein
MVHPALCVQLARQRQADLWREAAQDRLACQAREMAQDHATPRHVAAPAPAGCRAWLARLPLVGRFA